MDLLAEGDHADPHGGLHLEVTMAGAAMAEMTIAGASEKMVMVGVEVTTDGATARTTGVPVGALGDSCDPQAVAVLHLRVPVMSLPGPMPCLLCQACRYTCHGRHKAQSQPSAAVGHTRSPHDNTSVRSPTPEQP